jgi:energy-coupling factor transporter ATP-binding protein EcfA2
MIDTLLEEGRFKTLLDIRIQKRTNEFIESAKKDLERQASEKIIEKRKELSELEKSVDELQELIEAEKTEKIRECERELDAKRAELDEVFKKREDEILRKESEFLGKQEHLSKLVMQLTENRDEMVGQLIGLMPILQEMGFRTTSERQEDVPRAEKTIEKTGIDPIHSFTPLQGVPKSLEEREFLARLIKLVGDSGFRYDEKDLINFHVCTKSENFNILTGPSGIGKSSLPRFYAQALHASADGTPRFLSVSVKPGWLDSQELIGHFNALEGRFHPSSSGFYEFLISSAQESREPETGVYLCCLDEMNLSYVEHYFADFLSLLQAPIRDRLLRFFDENLCKADDPYRAFSQINLPRSLRFCGTVNIDETTKFFSPKVLDRVHIIEIAPVSLSTIDSWQEQPTGFSVEGDPVSERLFRSWLHAPGLVQEYVLKSISEFEEHLSGMGLRISPRTYKSICLYVSNARGLMESDDEAMDFAVFQKVLPALRGHTAQFREMLMRVYEICERKKYQRSSARIKLIAEAQVAMDFFNYSLA